MMVTKMTIYGDHSEQDVDCNFCSSGHGCIRETAGPVHGDNEGGAGQVQEAGRRCVQVLGETQPLSNPW